MIKRIEVEVTGKVQMVMFRDFSKRNARALNLCGTIENKEDRSVHIIAEGKEVDLQEFIARLHKGSFLARVRNVNVYWCDARNQMHNFEIIY